MTLRRRIAQPRKIRDNFPNINVMFDSKNAGKHPLARKYFADNDMGLIRRKLATKMILIASLISNCLPGRRKRT